MRPFRTFRPAAAALALFLAGCFTEIGNPGKEQQVTADFRIDYSPAPLPKAAAGDTAEVDIRLFRFNVVEANYRTAEVDDARIWKVPDSLGRMVDFTGRDPEAVLPPVAVPPGEWTLLKLESRIPDHGPLGADTLDWEGFEGAGYIKGTWCAGGLRTRFLFRLPAVPKVNLVYNQEILERWRVGEVYSLEFVFFARRWLEGVDPAALETSLDRRGEAFVLADKEHNPAAYDRLSTNFFRAFNSWKVWKEE